MLQRLWPKNEEGKGMRSVCCVKAFNQLPAEQHLQRTCSPTAQCWASHVWQLKQEHHSSLETYNGQICIQKIRTFNSLSKKLHKNEQLKLLYRSLPNSQYSSQLTDRFLCCCSVNCIFSKLMPLTKVSVERTDKMREFKIFNFSSDCSKGKECSEEFFLRNVKTTTYWNTALSIPKGQSNSTSAEYP